LLFSINHPNLSVLKETQTFYTADHEWICFADNGAYVGVCGFKLTGIRKIENIRLFVSGNNDIVTEGTPMLQLCYKDYIIVVHAPIDCRLLAVGNVITDGMWEDIIAQPEGRGWLFKIIPATPCNHSLISRKAYEERLVPFFDNSKLIF